MCEHDMCVGGGTPATVHVLRSKNCSVELVLSFRFSVGSRGQAQVITH